MKAKPSGNVFEQTTEFELARSKIITHGKDGKDYVGYRYLHYADGHGTNTTLIDCGMPSEVHPKSYQHRFIDRGRLFTFLPRPDDLANWRHMQRRILELMGEFQIHNEV